MNQLQINLKPVMLLCITLFNVVPMTKGADSFNQALVLAGENGNMQRFNIEEANQVRANSDESHGSLIAHGREVNAVKAVCNDFADLEERENFQMSWADRCRVKDIMKYTRKFGSPRPRDYINQENQALIDAVKEGNYVAVVDLLNADANPSTAENAVSVLIMAVCMRNKNIVEVLLDRGADVNYVGEGNYTALHWAALGGDVAIVNALFAKMVSPSHVGGNGLTAKEIATRCRSRVQEESSKNAYAEIESAIY